MYPADDLEVGIACAGSSRSTGVARGVQYAPGHPRLRMRHAQFHIDEAARDRWLELMGNAMATIDEETLPDKHRAAMWNHMERVAHMLVNAPTQHPGL